MDYTGSDLFASLLSLLKRWSKVSSHIEHMATRYCLDTEMVGDTNENMREVVINPCESTAMSQRWEMVMS